MAIDKVTLEILKNHCRAAAESMAYTLHRTAHSTFVKETEDFTTGLTTPDGETFAAPVELGVTWFVGLNYKTVIEMIDEYGEGDICMTNVLTVVMLRRILLTCIVGSRYFIITN